MSGEDRNGLHAVNSETARQDENKKERRFHRPDLKIRLPEDPLTKGLIGMIIMVLAFALIGYWSYNRIHLFEGYDIRRSASRQDAEGTRCELLGRTLVKYNNDGVFASDLAGRLKWSSAYSMQTPMSEICGGKMIIYEELGSHVLILSAEGTEGTYQVPQPIRKAVVSRSGVAAMILDNDTQTLIEMYTPSGSEIASIRTTLGETGYPLDLALTPNGKRLVVSYMALENGKLCGRIVMYDFSGYSGKDQEHISASFSYPETVFPDVFIMGESRAAAIGDDRFVVYTGASKPAESAGVMLEKEVVSCFYDEKAIGFIFRSDDTENRYEIDAYSFSGRHLMRSDFNFEYEDVRMESGEVLLHDSGNIYVYRTSGKQKLAAGYDKEVVYFRQIPGLRDYLVITPDSLDQIRIE